MYNVIFVCTGNMCRSPMAEGILKSKLAGLGRAGIAVASMGIHAPQHRNASPEAVAACAGEGVDISRHVSRQLVFDELKAADFIFVMESFHRDYIRTFVPQAADRIRLLASWPGGKGTAATFRTRSAES